MDHLDLSDFFITKSEAVDFSAKLNTVIDSMYTTSFDLDKSLQQQFGIHKRDLFIKLLRENNITNATGSTTRDFLVKIQTTVSSMPIVSLTLAFEPSDDMLKSLSQWFLFTLNKQVLFDIQTDPKLIAGITINYNGRFKDYSLGPMFIELIKKNMEQPQTPQQPIHQATQFMTVGR